MKAFLNAYFVILIALVIAGGFIGWLIAWLSGASDAEQSSATGWGCGAGLLACGVLRVVRGR